MKLIRQKKQIKLQVCHGTKKESPEDIPWQKTYCYKVLKLETSINVKNIKNILAHKYKPIT